MPDGGDGAAAPVRGEALTQAGVVFGTPEYLSPEQAMGEEADRRADLYSAGIVLYEMLTGRRPFEAASKVAIVSMHLTQKAMPVTQMAPDADIPRWLERVVEREACALARDAAASARAFAFAAASAFAFAAAWARCFLTTRSSMTTGLAVAFGAA